jgi:UDP-2,3-diacylglucosamine pyrophosphatase LpxH
MDYTHFKAKFVWSTKDYDRGRLRLVECQTDGLPPEPGSRAVDWWQQFGLIHPGEQQASAQSVNRRGTIKLKANRFLYMDVGNWLGNRQSFGVICGRLALVCDYHSSAPGTSSPPPDVPKESLLSEFLRMDGVVSHDDWCKMIPQPYSGDPMHLCIVIPDMHIPQAATAESRCRSRWAAYQKIMHRYFAFDETSNYGEGRDIFSSLKNISELTDFLLGLVDFYNSVRNKFPDARITLVQIGDMYELWARRPCLFSQSEQPLVVIPDHESVTSVGEWIAGTHFLHHELFAAFDECKAKLSGCVFLHGNHDSYLSVPMVVYDANRFLSKTLPGLAHEMFGDSGFDGFDYQATTIYSRQREHHQKDGTSGIFFEHGQRSDKSNRDGETGGPWFTNLAAYVKPLKALDTTRRETFVTGAAAMYLTRQQDFGLYVMGHTHDPVLKHVAVQHYTEDGNWIPLQKYDVVFESAASVP